MAASKKATHVVAHKKLYLAVDGKLQHVPAGTEMVLDAKAAEQMGKKVMKLGEQKAVDLTKGEPKSEEPGK
ncbi:MAG: hypothetical protein KAR42_15355 [candidate division Zixibacteria bacterium]|nr:hypothetical protein [candidate division Zixibacteria bacterium]